MASEQLVQLGTMIGLVLLGALQAISNRRIGAVNDAVNNRHPSEPKLRDRVEENTARMDRVERVVDETRECVQCLRHDVVAIHAKLDARADAGAPEAT